MDIVRPTKVLFEEIHYSFKPAYDQLKKLLNEYWDIQHTIFAKMNRIWHSKAHLGRAKVA
jgi:hypothetical protein